MLKPPKPIRSEFPLPLLSHPQLREECATPTRVHGSKRTFSARHEAPEKIAWYRRERSKMVQKREAEREGMTEEKERDFTEKRDHVSRGPSKERK